MVPPAVEGTRLPESVRVLYVDDDPDFAERVARFLSGDAFSVNLVTTADEALQLLAEEAIDCLVSEYAVPGTEGLELLRTVRTERPDVPFVLYTDRGDESVASEAISAGVTDYLRKPDGDEHLDPLAERVVAAVADRSAGASSTHLEARYRRVVEQSPAPIALLDEQGDILYANDAAAGTVGASSPDALVGRAAVSLIHPDDRERSCRRLKRVLDDRDSPPTRRLRLVGVDGETRYVDISTAPAPYRGEPAAQVVLNDVTEQKRTQQELRSAGSILSTLVENIPAGILAVDDSRRVLLVNEEFTQLFEIPTVPGDLIGRDCAAVAESVTGLFRDVDQFLGGSDRSASDLVSTCREELKLVDGRTLERSDTPVRIDEDRVGHLWMYHDITDHKRRERELREERALVESALNTLPDSFYAFDTDGTLLRWNDRLAEITGYTDEEIAEMTPLDFVDDEDSEVFRDAYDEVMETGYTSVEASFLTSDGERLPYEFNGSRLTDDQGTTLGIAGTGRDIAERKRYEETLTALRDATRSVMTAETREEIAEIACKCARDILDLPLNGVHLYDSTTDSLESTAISPKARELVGETVSLGRNEGIAWEVFETGDPQVRDDVRESDAVFNPDTVIRSEILLPLDDHGVFLAGSTTVGDFDETDVSLAKILAANVEAALDRADRERTLRRRETTLVRQNERLDQFASLIAHDLRNPLNVAQGRVEMATNHCDSAHLPKARRALDRIEELVGDVLALAREGRDVNEPERVPLEPVVADAAQFVGLEDADLGLTDTDIGRVVADRERLHTLFENLFRNAREHGGEHVRVGRLDDGDGFYVEDDGPGIPPPERDEVFNHGFTTAESGTGMGLSIVESIAQAHGWTVSVDDGREGGARFEFTGVEGDIPRSDASD